MACFKLTFVVAGHFGGTRENFYFVANATIIQYATFVDSVMFLSIYDTTKLMRATCFDNITNCSTSKPLCNIAGFD